VRGERGVIEREMFVAATPETVFGFLTDPVLMAEWFGISHNVEAHPGGVFRVEVSVGNVARGVYVEVIPHSRVAFSWGWESRDPSLSALSPGSSLVEIDLEPRNGGTLVRLRHSGLPDSLERIHGERWSHHLVELEAAVLESAAKRKNEPIARISKETA
jgi:uncharacterized protein YndB with AHSA1/START domain